MGLKIIDNSYEKNELSQNAKGGTEMMLEALYERVSPELLDKFQIIPSRVRELKDKPRILWCHDLAEDPEVSKLADSEYRSQFAKLVFVSNWQFTTYNKVLGVPYDDSVVLRNAIVPFEKVNKSTEGPVRIIYHTTPHRGLNILHAAYEQLSKMYGDKIHLDVYSSFKIYGWEQRDAEYEGLFEALKDHPHITYHGTKSNEEVREALSQAHIFAYPSIWQETSCIAAIEAMSAGCRIVCPSYAALPETTAGLAWMYPWTSDLMKHANIFANVLNDAIQEAFEYQKSGEASPTLLFQKMYADGQYNWDHRAQEWEAVLRALEI
jgi:UDP-glucose:(glucosyl)LPS alpha-1,2-glucosyltransferase